MKVEWTIVQLAAFEDDIASCFNAGIIRAPIHLESGNERQLIDVFRDHVDEDDWLLCTWRSHLKCLLKGVPAGDLKGEILAGHSMGLCFPEYRVLSSAIVGGTYPIAVGIAMGIKRSRGENKVVCFSGDMGAEGGAFHECRKYADRFKLPLLFVVEDDDKSVNTPTRETWGCENLDRRESNVIRYYYKNGWPHSGTGSFIQF